MINGLNHITLAVTDLNRSFEFYAALLGFKPRAKWARGAYLTSGDLWLCLTLDEKTRSGALPEYSHIAFDVTQQKFAALTDNLLNHGIVQWQQNSSEGNSLYFLDPDGHKLEIHVGDIASRIAAIRQKPYEDLQLFA